MGVIQEFKKFALRGNVIDMAVGIIIGAAFNGVVKSLVDDVIMPPIGLLTGKVNFKEQHVDLAALGSTATINYGSFINNLISFVIVAWAVFMLVKGMNAAEKRLQFGDVPAEEKPATPEDVLLLREIRDELKKK
jgi:large conductance mechanosensitive channel